MEVWILTGLEASNAQSVVTVAVLYDVIKAQRSHLAHSQPCDERQQHIDRIADVIYGSRVRVDPVVYKGFERIDVLVFVKVFVLTCSHEDLAIYNDIELSLNF
ncbi:hypothetical protein D3C75_1196590 [compost metagenome]